jgi:DNA-binding NarL/FixJ family response regulator
VSTFRVILADDHELIRFGLRNILTRSDQLEVVGEVGDSDALLEMLRSLPVDLLVLDISMPTINGIELTAIVKKRYPQLKVLILTMHQQVGYLRRALAAGADGYLVKTDCGQEIVSAIDRIRQGSGYVSPSLRAQFAEDLLRSPRDTSSAGTLEDLTRRETQVLALVVAGKTSKQMAAELNLSPRTVDHHRASLLRKFRLKNSVDLVNFAIRNGYVAVEG